MKAFFGRGAIIASILLLGLVAFSAKISIAETLFSPFQSQTSKQDKQIAKALEEAAETLSAPLRETKGVSPATHYVATAYSLRGRTASGRMVSKGLIAADPAGIRGATSATEAFSTPTSGSRLHADRASVPASSKAAARMAVLPLLELPA